MEDPIFADRTSRRVPHRCAQVWGLPQPVTGITFGMGGKPEKGTKRRECPRPVWKTRRSLPSGHQGFFPACEGIHPWGAGGVTPKNA